MFPGGVFVDVETTGHKSYSSHVIEVGAVILDEEREEIARFSILSNPGEEALASANPEALEVNKISLEMIRKAPPIEKAAQAFRKFLEAYGYFRKHAYNNEFDLWFLAREPWNIASKAWGECVMLAAMELMDAENAVERFPDGKAKWPKLERAAAFFGVPYGVGHRAEDDARCASRIYAEIIQRRVDCDEIRHYL